MKNVKKLISSLSFCLLIMLASTSCASAELKDGSYRAQMSDYDNGWKEYVYLTVSDGVIYDIVFDAENENGEQKNKDLEYRENMEPITGTYPEKYSKQLIENFKNADAVDSIDAITGATISSNNFNLLLNEALKRAREGNTDPAIVDPSVNPQ